MSNNQYSKKWYVRRYIDNVYYITNSMGEGGHYLHKTGDIELICGRRNMFDSKKEAEEFLKQYLLHGKQSPFILRDFIKRKEMEL